MEQTQFTEDFLRSVDVHGLLPQQEPFVMIDRLVQFGMMSAVSELEVRDSNIFADDGFLSASGMMENIAQTCAARVGFYNKYILHNEVQVGFIGAIRNYMIQKLPPVGTVITTRVDILEEVFGITLARAEIRNADTVFATAEIKLSVRNADAI